MLKNVRITDIGDSSSVRNAFELQDIQANTSVWLSCGSLKDKQFWLKCVKDTLKEYQRQKSNRMRAFQGMQVRSVSSPLAPLAGSCSLPGGPTVTLHTTAPRVRLVVAGPPARPPLQARFIQHGLHAPAHRSAPIAR